MSKRFGRNQKRRARAEIASLRLTLETLDGMIRVQGEEYRAEVRQLQDRFSAERRLRETTERAIFLKMRLPDDLPANAVAMARCQITVEHPAEAVAYAGRRELSVRPRGGERVTGELEILYLDESAESVLEGPYLTLVSGNAAMRVVIVDDCVEFLRSPGRREGFGETFRFQGVRNGEHSAVESAGQMIREMRGGNVVFILAARPQEG